MGPSKWTEHKDLLNYIESIKFVPFRMDRTHNSATHLFLQLKHLGLDEGDRIIKLAPNLVGRYDREIELTQILEYPCVPSGPRCVCTRPLP